MSKAPPDISKSDFEEILYSRRREASQIAERAAWRTAMAAPDGGRGGRIFSAFEADAQTVANLADNFKPRPSGWNMHGRSLRFSKVELV